MTPTTTQALLAHALVTLEASDMALAYAPLVPADGPCTVDELSLDTFQRMLAHGLPGVLLEQVSLAEAHDGMTTRNKWNLQWNAQGQQAGLPAQVFVKATPDGPYLRETLSMLHMAENEVRFYNQIQPEVPDLAPAAYYAQSYPGGRFMILMEVLENRGLTPYWAADHCSLAHAKAVVAALAQLHATYWTTERFNTDLAWVRPRTQRFGFEWHQRSFNTARQQYLQGDMGRQLPREIVDMIRFWDENDRQVYAYWDTLPATVLHGDSHLGNTFAYPDGRAGLFDWQVMYRGHGLRDVAYFFLGAVADDVRQVHEKEVVTHYLDQLEVHGVKLDRDAAWLNYCLFSLDRLDAHIKTYTRGGYGHAASGQERGRVTTIASILENGVPELLRHVVRNGKL